MVRAPSALLALTGALMMLGMPVAGWSLDLDPHVDGSAAKFTAEGNEALVLGEYEEAIRFYRSALEVDKRHFHAMFNLGLAYQEQQRWDEARRHYEEALLIRPDHPQVLCNLGIIAFATKDLDSAVNRFDAAAQVAAGSPIDAAAYLI